MSTRLDQANAIVKKYMNWSFVGGLIPIPLVDIAAVSGIQIKMLHELTELYGIPFKSQAAQTITGSLLGGVVPGMVAAGATSMVKFIPVIGTTLGIITMPALSLAATCAVGRVFITHFEAGGTLLDFDPEKIREHFRAEFESAQSGGRQAKA